jgi:hypothetical protein
MKMHTTQHQAATLSGIVCLMMFIIGYDFGCLVFVLQAFCVFMFGDPGGGNPGGGA